MEMTLVELDGNDVKIALHGRLDTLGVTAIEDRFAAAAARRNVVVDLSDVSFLGSLGIGMLIGAGRALTRSGNRIVLCSATARVNETIQNAGLGQILPMAPDEASALRLLDR